MGLMASWDTATPSDIGDDEMPVSAGDVDVGGTVVQLAAGGSHTCALLDTGAVRCWGDGPHGQLGYGNTDNIADDETPASSAGDVNVGGSVVQLAAGGYHTCALLDTGAVRCWGLGNDGQLGYGNTDYIGDDETPASAGDVDVGGSVVHLTAGWYHTCALLDTGAVRCWGTGFAGQLGYGNTARIGDDETPASVGDVDVGGTVVQLIAGGSHTCALLENGAVRCWGFGLLGRLGYGNADTIGDNETPASAGDVDVGGTVVHLTADSQHTCALLDNGAVRCWGHGYYGQLGYGNANNIGDNETPASAGNVDVGGSVVQLTAGSFYTCALLDNGAVRCWGYGRYGQLGYGYTKYIGDDETPASAGDIGVYGFESSCTDGIDNDGDGAIDCADTECIADTACLCQPGETLVQISAGDVPVPILDNMAVTSVINVPNAGTVQSVIVTLDSISHANDADLDISLISPATTSVDLSSDNGGDLNGYIGTVLNDNCGAVAGPITGGEAPFHGCFTPEEPLGTFAGQSPTGDWTLSVFDDTSGDQGTINAWTLSLCVL